MVSLEYIEGKIKEFLSDSYGIELEVPVRINKRLRNVYGAVNIFQCPNGEVIVDSIEFHPGILETNRYDRIRNLIKHEAIHYALIKKGGDFRDCDVEFKHELQKHNVGSCDLELKHIIFVYKCVDCLKVTDFGMRKKGNIKCQECGGELRINRIHNNFKGMKKEVEDMKKEKS